MHFVYSRRFSNICKTITIGYYLMKLSYSSPKVEDVSYDVSLDLLSGSLDSDIVAPGFDDDDWI